MSMKKESKLIDSTLSEREELIRFRTELEY